MTSKSATFAVSQDVNTQFKVLIGSLEGFSHMLKKSKLLEDPLQYQKQSNVDPCSELIVSAQIVDNEPLTIPIHTGFVSFKKSRKWNQWLTLPINISQLTLSSKLVITIWEYVGNDKIEFGKCAIELFNTKDCTLKRGSQVLKITPSPVQPFEAVLTNLENGDVKEVPWLDSLVRKKISELRKPIEPNQYTLYISLLHFDVPVVYGDFDYSMPMKVENNEGVSSTEKISTGERSTLKIYDPEHSEPIEEKFRRLERSQQVNHLLPTGNTRASLNTVISYPPTQKLTAHEKNMIWKYRYFLVSNKNALTKLIKSVNFTEDTERQELLRLLGVWAEIDIEDALELLSPHIQDVHIRAFAVQRLMKAGDNELELYLLQLVQALSVEILSLNTSYLVLGDSNSMGTGGLAVSPLAEFLVTRALESPRLSSFLYWFLEAEGKCGIVLEYFMTKVTGDIKANLERQIDFVNLLTNFCEKVKGLKDTTPKKIELLKSLLQEEMVPMLSGHPVILPLDPSVVIRGVLVDDCSVFKSSLSPLRITFITEQGSKYPLMFKLGDDLRQDQLVVQTILLMNSLLENENVDLKLTPYKILATSPNAGAIQFIVNSTMASILSDYHGIIPYFQQHAPATNKLGVDDTVMDNFVKSCAGYCVITYILGVGDRHLDNLLIAPTGHFFHADFGYILGADPKPFPPLMKLPPQLVEGFGGEENYDKFRSYCFVAYSILRKNANLILNLFEMSSSIEGVTPEGMEKLEEKFCLEMSEEEAVRHFQVLINDSINALLPIVIDRLHNLTQYWKK